VDGWEEGGVDVEESEHLDGPGSIGDVEEEGAAGVGDFGGVLAGQAEADKILGEEDVAGFFVDAGLVLADPKDFGCGKASEGGVANEVDEAGSAAGFGFDLVALLGGALIVPEEGGAEGARAVGEEDAAMHLTGQADGGDVRGAKAGGFEAGACGANGGEPPVERVLLGPAGLGLADGVGGGGGGEDFAAIVADEGFGAAGADVDAEEVWHGLSPRRGLASAARIGARWAGSIVCRGQECWDGNAEAVIVMRLKELARLIGAEVADAKAGEVEVRSAAALEDAEAGQVSFLSNLKYQSHLQTTRASAVIVATATPGDAAAAGVALLRAGDPYYAFMQAVVALHGHRKHPVSGIDPRAYVDETAKIGAGTIVYPGAFVGPGVVVGRECILYANCAIYEGCVLGDRVIVHSCAVVGNDGFGYATHKGVHHKIPQVGNVVIEDDVEIGAGAVIARAALGSTIIGRGTKLDSVAVVGHGTRIGEHSLLVALCGIAGSVSTGHHFVAGGQAGVAGHLKIGDCVSLAAQTGVTGDLADNSVMGGSPAMPLQMAKRIALLCWKMPELFARVRDVEKQVGIKGRSGGGDGEG
jgi:UDP-3-O-[3-hydroxymyristoyl] glucosamine N-acyltransferase